MTRTIRGSLITLLLVALTSALAIPAVADTSDTTDASVTITDAGVLDVHWSGDPVSFLTNGNAPNVSAVDGATATATFSLVIDDTRADDNRPGYMIALSATPFTTDGSDQGIAPSQLRIVAVEGLPEGFDATGAQNASLDTMVTLLSVPDGSAAISTTVGVTIEMTIPAGTPPGTFSGTISVDILPAI